MIHKLKIERLRGIRSGTLEGLKPLTILVGPNGAGKSAILDALLIGASPTPGSAVIQAIQRHKMPTDVGGGRWLLWMSGAKGPAEIEATLDDNVLAQTELKYQEKSPAGSPNTNRLVVTCSPPRNVIDVIVQPGQWSIGGGDTRTIPVPSAHLIETWADSPIPLHGIHTRAAEQGTRAHAFRIIQSLVPEIEKLEILTDDNHPFLAADYGDRAVPVALAGDGVHALIRLCYELAVAGSGLVLLEEPEIHQHPAALLQTAAAILAAVRNGVQVVLSTHSLELIDAFIAKATDEDIDRLALFRVRLEDGLLRSSRLEGNDTVLSRTQIEDDLR